MRISMLVFLAAGCCLAQRQRIPEPPWVDPGDAARAPADAVVLFDGTSVEKWTRRDGSPTGCKAENKEMVCVTGSGDAVSTEKYRSAQIHLEFAPPVMPDHKGQLKANSGVYLVGKYELQILDSYRNPTYGDGALGGLYGQAAPLVNAARPPGEWQTYDIIYRSARCDASGKVTEKPLLTVLVNGVLVHDHVAIARARDCEPGPLLVQDHSGFPGAPVTVMKFRNIWLRHLDLPAQPAATPR